MELTPELLIIINAILLFVVKVFDNMITTSKTILIQKNKKIFASMTVVVSQIIFYKLIETVNAQGDSATYIIAIAGGIGTYLALIIADRFSKERTYINVILSDDFDEMKKLRQFLMDNKITNVASECYAKEDWNKTINITAYAKTKDESRLIDEYLEKQDVKFKRLIDKV